MDWIKQDKHIEIPIYAIARTRKKDGRWEYQEIDSGEGDWSEVAYILWNDYGQFKDRIVGYANPKDLHERLDAIALSLESNDKPYEFTLPDGTDTWYYAYSKTASFKINHEGELV